MKRIMIDLETLDTKPTALILSLGAVVFDPNEGLVNGKFGQEFNMIFDMQSSVPAAFTMDPSTIQFWLKMPRDARSRFFDPGVMKWSMYEILDQFKGFLSSVSDDSSLEIWGNGADFDNVILDHAYRVYGLKKPWGVYDNRCFRTLKNLGLKKPDWITREEFGPHHDALADAKYQAAFACEYLKMVG